jgi:nanoRNase/pAp phosphatase (c-di-AMP/oligoRNAs hydrolase)
LAANFGGGGHFNAAGCTVPMEGDLERSVENFVKEVKNLIS